MIEWLNIESDLLKEIETENVSSGYTPIESGAYIVNIEQAYLRQTDSGAVMFELETATEDNRKISWSTCIVSGDEKGNKSTYTDKKTKKERPLPGLAQVSHLFEACKLDMDAVSPSKQSVKRGESTINAKVFKELSDKKFTACVRQYENEYNGDVSIRIDIENFLDTDGKNSKGDYLVDKFNAKIEKSPIKLLKKSKTSAAAVDSSEAAASGW